MPQTLAADETALLAAVGAPADFATDPYRLEGAIYRLPGGLPRACPARR